MQKQDITQLEYCDTNDILYEHAELLGNNIKRIREEKGITQKVLANAINSNQPIVSRVENDKAYSPNLLTIAKIAKALKVSIQELFSPTQQIFPAL